MKYLNPTPTLAPIGWLITVLALVFFAGIPQGSATTDAREGLKLALAKVCVNEAGFSSMADCALIHDASGSTGQSSQTRLNWLNRHSRRVLGDRECGNRRNCQWTRNLTWADTMPEGWDTANEWHPRHWAQVRRWAHGLVYGTITLHPCPNTPQTWGGRMDHERAVNRGLEPLGCVGTLNEGYRYDSAEPRPAVAAPASSGETPEGAIPASLAAGSRRGG